jgi:hypothetical protein
MSSSDSNIVTTNSSADDGISKLEEILKEQSENMDRDIENEVRYDKYKIFGRELSLPRLRFYKSAILKEIEFLYSEWKSIKNGRLY